MFKPVIVPLKKLVDMSKNKFNSDFMKKEIDIKKKNVYAAAVKNESVNNIAMNFKPDITNDEDAKNKSVDIIALDYESDITNDESFNIDQAEISLDENKSNQSMNISVKKVSWIIT